MNRCRRNGEDFNVLLTRYAIERLLFRLTQTPYAARFTLKGAMLFTIWMDKPHRPTLDVDLLGKGEPGADELKRIFREVCDASVEPDGMQFDPATARVDAIREDHIYQGLRVRLLGHLGSARIPLQVDVSFGDVITPMATVATFGPLLDLPPPVIAAYPPETVIAEKLEAMAVLGMANSRMKDYFDIYAMCRKMSFDGKVLAAAVRATFRRRRTAVPQALPPGLSREFSSNSSKRVQWAAFVRRIDEDQRPTDFDEVVDAIARFAAPILRAAASGAHLFKTWIAPGPWREPLHHGS